MNIKSLVVDDGSGQKMRPFLKNGVYSGRITSFEGKMTAAKNPMIIAKYELVAPETVLDNEGKTVSITGLEVTDPMVFGPKNKGTVEKFDMMARAYNLSDNPDIDDGSALATFKGKAFRFTLHTEAKAMIDENTNMPVLGADNQPIQIFNYRIGRIIGADKQFTVDVAF